MKPEQVFKAGAMTASVWTNERDVNGDIRELKSVTFQKRYKDKEDWKTTNSLNASDLPKAIVVLSKAYEFLTLKEQETA